MRLPVEPFRGATPVISEAIRDRRYLRELARQAAIFNACFAEAMETAAHETIDECWRHLQGALFAGIVVNRLINPTSGQRGWPGTPKRQAERIAQARARRLRSLVQLPDPPDESTPLFTLSRVRDSLEHIDERLDRVLWDEAQGGPSDWYLSDGQILGALPTPERPDPTPVGMRAFIPRAGLLLFNTEALNMFQLDLDMLTLRLQSREATEQINSKITGRLEYGGVQLIELHLPDGSVAVEEWKVIRQDRLELLSREFDAQDKADGTEQ